MGAGERGKESRDGSSLVWPHPIFYSTLPVTPGKYPFLGGGGALSVLCKCESTFPFFGPAQKGFVTNILLRRSVLQCSDTQSDFKPGRQDADLDLQIAKFGHDVCLHCLRIRAEMTGFLDSPLHSGKVFCW